MLRTRRFYWLAQIGGWGLLSLLLVLSAFQTNDSEFEQRYVTYPERFWLGLFIFFLVGITISHLMRLASISLGWLDMKIGPLIPRILLISLLAAALMSLLNNLSSTYIEKDPRPLTLAYILIGIFTNAIFFLSWNGIYFAFHFFQKSRVQEVKNLQLSASQNEIELKNLRSQLNPHFLFNSLNSIRALIDINPLQAKENLTTLSNLLRKSLVLGKEQLVSLKEELEIVNDYLDLEKVRFEERLAIEVEHDPKLDDFPVPPFMIQTLVENAFKHGISRLIEGGTITIRTEIGGSNVTITVINDGTLGQSVDTGIGLQNTLRRLELQYPQNSQFSLKEEDGKVIATIELMNQI